MLLPPRKNGLSLLAALTATIALAGCGEVTKAQVDGGGTGGGTGGSSGSGGAAGGSGGSGSGGTTSGSGGTGGAYDAAVESTDVAGGTCAGLTESQCRSRPGCAVGTCAGCSGGPSFAGCYRAGEVPPPCAGFACPSPPCYGLDEATCKARAGECRSNYCPGCQEQTFRGCSAHTDPLPVCPAVLCAQPCAQVTTLERCEERGDCHSVFVDDRSCGCAALGCCARFSRCVAGDRAQCNGSASCEIVEPHCEGNYVIAYTALCYEGCVQKKDCAP